MNITTTTTDLSEIYDAVQTGEITRPDGSSLKMGDTINHAFIMVNEYHLEPYAPGEWFTFETTIRNHSTKRDFLERYIAKEPAGPLGAAHLEILSETQTPFVISAA